MESFGSFTQMVADQLPEPTPRTHIISGNRLWVDAAHAAGWSWSRAHSGYINEAELDPYDRARHYWVADDARAACDRSGIETEAQARDIIEERGA